MEPSQSLSFSRFALYRLGMSSQTPAPTRRLPPKKARFAIVAARFNEEIVEKLLAGCLTHLSALGVTADRLETVRVPGAFELPLAAQALAQTKKFAAVICLGAVIRGDTPHFDFVASQAASGIQQAALNTGVPIIFGVLTTDNLQQAQDRCGGKHGHAGERAADAAVEMAAVLAALA
jgi:6,7-dimethyl-8-ribityllumazine synthase